jgi:hypothetical protein
VITLSWCAALACTAGTIITGDRDSGARDGGADANDCGPTDCPDGTECVAGTCVPRDPCRDVVCENPGDVCAGGICVAGGADGDGDGFPVREDCDDAAPLVIPGVERSCVNACGEGRSECLPDGSWSACTFVVDPCALDHAVAACVDESCAVVTCTGSWDDCDGNPANGCEIEIGTARNCSRCGDACAAGLVCEAGACRCIPDCSGVECGGGDGCGGRCDSGWCPAGHVCDDGDCVCVPDCGGAACGDGDGCGGSCDGDCPPNERCRSDGCECPGPHYRRVATGRCLPSCGTLLDSLGLYDNHGGCCSTGCRSGLITGGSPGDTWDCTYCCEGDPSGASSCR